MTEPCWCCGGTQTVARKVSPYDDRRDVSKKPPLYAYGVAGSAAFAGAEVAPCPECRTIERAKGIQV